MIISASRRTDIPAIYTDWFFGRLKAGFALVRNPMNFRQIGRVLLDRAHVDGFVFWTKNPVPIMQRLHELDDWPYYFQFTLNSYGKDVEPEVPEKSAVLIPAFRELSRRIGRKRVLWRYDPVLFSDKYDRIWHLKYFREIASRLSGSTEVCTVSFLDEYVKTRRNTSGLGIRRPDQQECAELLIAMLEIARHYGIEVRACAEPDISRLTGVPPARCIDANRLARISGYNMEAPVDHSQGREGCCCSMSIDIGVYDTCTNGCVYCYANSSSERAANIAALHDAASPIMAGVINADDKVRDRKMPLYRKDQLSFIPQVKCNGKY